MTASDDEDDVLPRGSEMKLPGVPAQHPYQTSGAATRMTGPPSRGAEVADVGYRGSEARKSGVDVSGADYRQFDHTTIDREVVIDRFSPFGCLGSVVVRSSDS